MSSTASIRLVQIHPSLSPDGHIQCNIVHATVDDTYTCLSYRWGEPTPSRAILVNDQPFKVRENLFNFLNIVHARFQSDDTTVLGPYWIDALSINQLDVHERNHQVAQMGKMFATSADVYTCGSN
jgi:hypothetical protein